MELDNLFNLEGKVAIVTGASKGIGKGLALILARYGADVALIARNEEELEKVSDEIKSMGRKALPVRLDLTRVDDIPDSIEKIQNHFGKIDILVNNAGTNIPKPSLEVTEEDWDKVLDINLKSTFFISQAAGKMMIDNKKGKIINISSQMGMVGYFNRSAYCSSKGGVIQLTRALAVEWASHNILVNCISPTFIETPLTKSMFEDKEFYNEIVSRIPLGKLAKTEDLYGALLYLASDSSNMVTGQSITVDGGWTVW